MSRYVHINGRLVREREAQISVFDSALLYGEGLFETLRAVEGRILFLDRHLDRFWRSCRAIGFSKPVHGAILARRLKWLLKVNRLKDAYLRINVSLKETEAGDPKRLSRGFHIILFAKPFVPYPDRCYTQGARLVIVHGVVNDPLPLSNIKSTNYLPKILGRREVVRRGADEGILLNTAGRITEGTSSNVFIVKNGVVTTPPLSEGVMPGVTRDLVHKICNSLNISYLEMCLTPKWLIQADEVFITSTLKGVMPVARVEGKRRSLPIGPVTREIGRRYQALVASCCERVRSRSSRRRR